MEELHYRIIERLRQDPTALSRNRHFHAFEDPELAQARRVHRLLLSLERDLLRPGVTAEATVGEALVTVTLRFPTLQGKRVVSLSQREFELLLYNPELRRRLAPAG